MFTTAVLWVGSKSLSHVLAGIERTKDRLLDAGAVSEAARAQIIAAVMAYWGAHPGVAVSIVEKLLNYAILSPAVVVQWALSDHDGSRLSQAHVYEMVAHTVAKVTGRARQVLLLTSAAGGMIMDVDGASAAGSIPEVQAMRDLFKLLDDSLVAWASGSKDEMIEAADSGSGGRDLLVKHWGKRWLRVFRRRAAIEEAFVVDVAKRAAIAAVDADGAVANGAAVDADVARANGSGGEGHGGEDAEIE